jgi:apolipoprotein N-acyltransferase
MHECTTLGEATGFDLAWTFMGFSFAYILFIGLAEIVGAWLLLCAIFYLNKERVLGALQALVSDAGSEWAPKGQRVKTAIAVLVAIGLLFAIDQMLVNLLGYGEG